VTQAEVWRIHRATRSVCATDVFERYSNYIQSKTRGMRSVSDIRASISSDKQCSVPNYIEKGPRL
jgi:hypothetical protein